eukprot:EG_transcript_21978
MDCDLAVHVHKEPEQALLTFNSWVAATHPCSVLQDLVIGDDSVEGKLLGRKWTGRRKDAKPKRYLARISKIEKKLHIYPANGHYLLHLTSAETMSKDQLHNETSSLNGAVVDYRDRRTKKISEEYEKYGRSGTITKIPGLKRPQQRLPSVKGRAPTSQKPRSGKKGGKEEET